MVYLPARGNILEQATLYFSEYSLSPLTRGTHDMVSLTGRLSGLYPPAAKHVVITTVNTRFAGLSAGAGNTASTKVTGTHASVYPAGGEHACRWVITITTGLSSLVGKQFHGSYARPIIRSSLIRCAGKHMHFVRFSESERSRFYSAGAGNTLKTFIRRLNGLSARAGTIARSRNRMG